VFISAVTFGYDLFGGCLPGDAGFGAGRFCDGGVASIAAMARETEQSKRLPGNLLLRYH
jgi:hypothetical protein